MMQLSEPGLNLIKTFEGYKAAVYDDVAGHPTIGYGHKLVAGEVYPYDVTEEQATAILLKDVAWAEQTVNMLVNVPLTQGQFDALVDFTYNLGAGTLERSTLLRVLNEKRYDYAADQFQAWDHAGGVEVDGLKRRREAEQQ